MKCSLNSKVLDTLAPKMNWKLIIISKLHYNAFFIIIIFCYLFINSFYIVNFKQTLIQFQRLLFGYRTEASIVLGAVTMKKNVKFPCLHQAM